MTTTAGDPHYLPNVIGKVVEVIKPYKAVVEFAYQGTKQRALLKLEKLTIKKNLNPDGGEENRCITDFVKLGTIVKFLCHIFDIKGDDRCGWYVADVNEIDPADLTDPSMLTGNICSCPMMFNKKGFISKIDKRQGVLSFADDDDPETCHEVLFLASKLYIRGKRVNVKQSLDNFVALNDKVYFDAVPIDPEENDNRCAWFATVAWINIKPEVDYDTLPKDSDSNLAQIKMLIKNPRSQFIRGVGQIMQILNNEYGILLGAVNQKQTHWQSILFHRSCVSLFKFNLAKVDLQKVFKEGDKIRFIAAAAPKGFSAQWVASHISVDVVGDAQFLVLDLI